MDTIIEKLGTIADYLARIATALEGQNRTAPGHVDTLEATVGFTPEAAGESAIHAGPNGLGVAS